jgi:hypothetical protein
LVSSALAFACTNHKHATAHGPTASPNSGDAPPAAPAPSYDAAQTALEQLRYPGPKTSSGSTAACTANHLVWREAGTSGAVHSWDARSKAQTDYAFKATHAALFVPSDSFIVVGGEDGSPESGKILVYQTGTPNTLVATLPEATGFAATDGAVIRADQTVDDKKLDGTKARRWNGLSAQTVDLSDVLPTHVPPAAFAADQLVIPSKLNAPSTLYVVDVKNSTTSSVTFDEAVIARQILPSAEGLFVSYVRGGDEPALRLYRNNQNSPDARYELGDDLANRPMLFANSPPDEHRLEQAIAMHGRTLLYASKHGIFAYDFASGDLSPVQLSAGKGTFVPDVMCVITEQNVLVYREIDDSAGQTWMVSLAPGAPP